MIPQSLKIVRNSIFAVTVSLAAVIVTMPSGASDKNLIDKMGAFSGLVTTSNYNPDLVLTVSEKGGRYRLNSALPSNDTLYKRSIFSVKFDQKNLLPLAATSKTFTGLTRQSGLKQRRDIAFDRDRSLLADFQLTGN